MATFVFLLIFLINCQKSTLQFNQLKSLNAYRLNNTRKAEIDVIFFNRCAKVGSEALLELFQVLESFNDLNLERDGLHAVNKRQLKRFEQLELAEKISELSEGSVWIQHVNWIDFEEFDLPKPIYINMVRDPVDRVISWYFYVRGAYKNAVEYLKNPKKPLKSESWYKKDFNHCVRNGDPECQYVPFSVKDYVGNFKRQSLFFCGHHDDCIPFNSPTAVQMAKEHVERDYAVVGTWEETNITLTVFEKYIPKFFNSAKFLFEMNIDKITNRNKNKRKPKIDADVKEMIRKNFTHEYEFYHFCKQRLYKQYLAMQSLNVHDLNNTRKAQLELIFFNRVPKVGSQTFMELLRRLSERNNFQFHRDAVQKVETIRLAEDQQQELAEVISDLPEPSVFIKHVCYTNFTKFKLPTPIYINVVRDPVERVISWFYYVRAPWYFVERKAAFPDLPLPHPAWLKKDFETCVLSGDQECTYTQGVTVEGIGDHRRQSLFFCGHAYECTPFNTVGALERAKHAVESQYAVVGVLEDLNATLSVFEKYIPRFFQGVREIYDSSAEYLTKINKNNFKPPVSEKVKDIVRRNFTYEIEFYQFCRQRLHKQYLAANLPDKTMAHLQPSI